MNFVLESEMEPMAQLEKTKSYNAENDSKQSCNVIKRRNKSKCIKKINEISNYKNNKNINLGEDKAILASFFDVISVLYKEGKIINGKSIMYYNEPKEVLRGIKIPYSSLLPYKRAEGKIILLSSFTSTIQNQQSARRFSGRNKAEEQYKNKEPLPNNSPLDLFDNLFP